MTKKIKNSRGSSTVLTSVIFVLFIVAITALIVVITIESTQHKKTCEKETVCYHVVHTGSGIYGSDVKIYVDCEVNLPSSVEIIKEVVCKDKN